MITLFNVPAFLAIVLGIVALFLIGAIIEILLFSPVAKDKVSNPMEYSMVITFALNILLKNAAVALFGSHYRNIPIYNAMVFGISAGWAQLAEAWSQVSFLGLLNKSAQYC